ncbi:thioesterase II family protein [Streptomyces atroolivaceus]|uniref:Thioesterase II family protein n=1 Tax=Streptomyces atroolivaceus TaxID=66869 RepID=A0ABV9VFG7_STRAZ|nr:alpha/beta fold hydrolase [Streptomyces atroolivaceus]
MSTPADPAAGGPGGPRGRRPGETTAGGTPSPYLLPRQADPAGAPLRLFCFHHAGGSASSFSGWQPRLGGGVTVVPVQLPGREHRAREPRLHDFARLLDELDEALDPLMDAPYAFYGHSMGGIVAYEMARRRFAQGRTPPRQLLVGACPPPHAPRGDIAPDRVTDEELTAWMTGLGGLPELVLRYPEWLRLAVAVLRDDLRLAHGRAPGPGPGEEPLPVPIRVFAGSSDPLVTPGLAAGWARHTSADFRVFNLPGGHFFHRSAPTIMLRLISSLLAAEYAARS